MAARQAQRLAHPPDELRPARAGDPRLPGGTTIKRATLFGLPLQQHWSHAETGDFAPTYYMHSDAPLYYYSFTDAYAGQLTWAQATRDGRIELDGLPALVRAFPTWNARSMFAHIRPVSRTASSPAG
jgi:hypothetical protein